MPRIHDLPEDVSNKIAAGEVIERPASVVKELIENSLDASSDRIEIETVRAGRRLIRVSDNGTGMDKEDALKAADRYATSKLHGFEDLQTLASYGFRGEALSSIAAVSRMKLISSPREIPGSQPPQSNHTDTAGLGVCIEIAGGEIGSVRNCPSVGTTVEVRDIFFNTPARLKFLKSEQTENYHIIDVVMRQSLSNYAVSFSLVMDGREVLCLPPAGSLRERLAQVYGSQYAFELIETSETSRYMNVVMFLGKGSLARSSRVHQYLFVNRRPVRDLSLSHSIQRAYEGFIPGDKYPVFFVFLDADPGKVDVNVHPTKREVRFSDTHGVKDFIYRAAHAALRDAFPAVSRHHAREADRSASPEGPEGQIPIDGRSHDSDGVSADRVSDFPYTLYAAGIPSIYLGDTFVAVPTSEGLSIIDYHAAHERINYERFLRHGSGSVCRLLFPQQVRLDPAAYETLMHNRTLLSSVGVEIDDFGRDSVLVRGLPDVLGDADLTFLLSDIALSLCGFVSEGGSCGTLAETAKSRVNSGEGISPLEERRKAVAARLACHASMRGRDIPDGPRLSALLKDLDAADNPAQCPHGRPTRIVLSLSQLKKMFRKN